MDNSELPEPLLDDSTANISTVPVVSRCLRSFGTLFSAVPQIHYLEGPQLRSVIQDCNGRFRVWSGNIGAHQTGKSSLDYRLREASYIKKRVLRLLEDLVELLSDATLIISGARQPLEDVVSESDSSDSDSEPEADKTRPSELRQIITEISEVINCLYRLSMSVRNPTGKQRYIKAAHIDTSFYEEYDVRYVEQKFPSAKAYLTERLGKAISQRRQYLKYRETHATKLAQRLDDKYTGTVMSETTASALLEVHTVPENSKSVGSESSQSYATSGGSEIDRIRMPSMPKQARGGLPFECPYCRTIECVKDTHAWMKHVYQDLQPYMCTFERCAAPNEMYEGRRQWFNHELQKHRRVWTCHSHCNRRFNSEEMLMNHLRKYCPGQYSDAQLPTLIAMWVSSESAHAEASCPLCDRLIAGHIQLQKHIGRHLEEIALFAISNESTESDDEGDDGASTNASDGSGSSSLAAENLVGLWCDRCKIRISKIEYHCSICNDGEFDLCETCFMKGQRCHDSRHPLAKIFSEPRPNQFMFRYPEELHKRPSSLWSTKEQMDDGVDASQTIEPLNEILEREAPPYEMAVDKLLEAQHEMTMDTLLEARAFRKAQTEEAEATQPSPSLPPNSERKANYLRPSVESRWSHRHPTLLNDILEEDERRTGEEAEPEAKLAERRELEEAQLILVRPSHTSAGAEEELDVDEDSIYLWESETGYHYPTRLGDILEEDERIPGKEPEEHRDNKVQARGPVFEKDVKILDVNGGKADEENADEHGAVDAPLILEGEKESREDAVRLEFTFR